MTMTQPRHLYKFAWPLLSLICFVGCDDSEGTITKKQLATAQCERMEECDTPIFSFMADIEDCVSMTENAQFSDCDNYDGTLGTTCKTDALAMTCDDFNAAVGAAAMGDYSAFPDACTQMCE